MAEHAVKVAIPGLEWDGGAPEPMVLATEQRTLFAFWVFQMADSGSEDVMRVAEFVDCASHRFGFPNDEALGGHRLYGKGLDFYAVHEVRESAWLHELCEIESGHHNAPAEPFPNARHWILTFHDTTLEAIAKDILVIGDYPNAAAALKAAVGPPGTQTEGCIQRMYNSRCSLCAVSGSWFRARAPRHKAAQI